VLEPALDAIDREGSELFPFGNKIMKRLFAAHPTVFLFVVFAFIIDVVMVASTGGLWRDGSFAIGSTLVVAYFFGISSFLRFVVFRNRIHAGITWAITILLWFGWFALQVAINQGQYRPSLLFIMCLVAAFKTMRLEQSEEEKIEAEQRLANDQSKTIESESDEYEHNYDGHEIIDKKNAPNRVAPPPEPAPPKATPIDSTERTNTGENQNSLRSLKQVLAIMAAIGCLVSLWDMPDDYYKVLRFIVVAACAAIIWNIQKSGVSEISKTLVSVAFGMVAVFFNPIMPINLEYDKWIWIRIVALMLFTGGTLRRHSFQSFLDWWSKNGVKAIGWITIFSGVAVCIIGTFAFIKESLGSKIISDETAARYYREIDTATGEDLAIKTNALEAWADAKDAERKKYWDHLTRVYTDFENYIADEGFSDSKGDSRYLNANWQFIPYYFGTTLEDLGFYPSKRDEFTTQLFGKKNLSEKETFELIKEHFFGNSITKAPTEIIDDATATRIYNEIDNATGEEKQLIDELIPRREAISAGDEEDAFRAQWQQEREKEAFNEKDTHFSKLFTDDDYYQAAKEQNYALAEALDPEATAKRSLINAYLEHQLGREIPSANYEPERDAFAMANYGKKNLDDGQLFEAIRGTYTKQMIEKGKRAFEITTK
jgi:hypothetical protein